MLFSRKIGKLLLGKATALQVLVAATVGAMLGFVPGVFLLGFGQGLADAPALIFSLLFVVLVLNTNLAIFGLTFVLTKLAAIALLPVSFAIGRFFLEGPTEPIFRWLVNAPFFAWFGLERYATTGGLALGFVVGLALGLLMLHGLRVLQSRMAKAEDSERYRKWASKFWVRTLSWLFLGARPKEAQFAKLVEEKRKGSPVRIAGLVAVVVIGVGLYLAQSFLAGPTLRKLAQSGLENWNGATVDLAEAGVDLSGGRVSIGGLALADPNDLDRDSFRARSLDVAIGTGELLSKRFVIDEVSSREASARVKRDKPGVRIGDKPAPPAPPKDGEGKTLEDYVKEAQAWKDKLQRISSVLQKLVGDGSTDSTGDDDGKSKEDARKQAELLGLARATATGLVRGSPRLWIRKLVFDGVKVVGLGEDLLDVNASNLSSAPGLVDEPLRLDIKSRSGKFGFEFLADPSKSKIATTKFVFNGLAIDSIAKELTSIPLRGGTLDLALGGKLDFSRSDGTWLDLPLSVTLRNTTLEMKGIEKTKLDELQIPLGLRGPLAAPRITIETKTFVNALVAAGKSELAKRVSTQMNALIGDKIPGVGGDVGDIITGKKTPAQLAEEAKKRALEEAKKRGKSELDKLIPGGLPGGLFGGEKKTGDKKPGDKKPGDKK